MTAPDRRALILNNYGALVLIYFILKFMFIFYTGHVGPPLPYTYIKLFDAPEYDYYAKNNQGEVSHVFIIKTKIIQGR